MIDKLNSILSYFLLPISKFFTFHLDIKEYFLSRKSEELMNNKSPVVFTFWHHDIPLLLYAYKNRYYYPLVSLSKDGELIIPLLRHYKYGYIRGSSTRGSVKALYQGLELLKNKKSVLLAVDGPVGPRYSFKKGAIYLSQNSNTPIIPVVGAVEKKITINSWDKMELPLPFSLCITLVGKPFYCDSSPVENQISQIKNYMLQLEQQAEELLKKRIQLKK